MQETEDELIAFSKQDRKRHKNGSRSGCLEKQKSVEDHYDELANFAIECGYLSLECAYIKTKVDNFSQKLRNV